MHFVHILVGVRIASGVYLCTVKRELGREVLAADPNLGVRDDHRVNLSLRSLRLLRHSRAGEASRLVESGNLVKEFIV